MVTCESTYPFFSWFNCAGTACLFFNIYDPSFINLIIRLITLLYDAPFWTADIPDIIMATETWLNDLIKDSELRSLVHTIYCIYLSALPCTFSGRSMSILALRSHAVEAYSRWGMHRTFLPASLAFSRA